MISRGVVDRERRLREVGEPFGLRGATRSASLDRLDEDDRVGRFADRALDLLVARVPDQEDRVAAPRIVPRLGVHLRHERAGRVDRLRPRARGALVDRGRDAVRREDDRRARGTSSSLSTKIAPRSSSSRTTCALCTICLRT